MRRPGDVTFHTTPPNGCQNQNSNSRHKLANKTYVLLSMGSGTMRVHQRLNAGRAMMLCCNANSVSSVASTSNAYFSGISGTLSMCFGTTRALTKPTAEQNVAKNTAYATTP